MNWPRDELLQVPLSSLNQYAYCPRRCYLIHAEGEFEDNVHTVSGTLEHERVDQGESRAQGGVRVEYALPVWSERLGLSGRCDVVEFHPDGTIYPVEYKHGKRRRWLNDDLQLAGQALCLEEMMGRPVPKGAIFHQKSKRRREVLIDAAIRSQVAQTALAIRAMLESGISPGPVDDPRRCGECSLKSICQPELLRGRERVAALAASLFEPENE
jgi:CRISPR-associated exonuclease Cas4